MNRIALALCFLLLSAVSASAQVSTKPVTRANAPSPAIDAAPAVEPVAAPAQAPAASIPYLNADTIKTLQNIGLFAAFSLGPVAVLMLTSFVRINIVLILLRQALGSPQVPGNQVLTALALLLTILVMRPAGEEVYKRGVVPFTQGKLTPEQAWEAGSHPIKLFMAHQIVRTNHEHYLTELYEYAEPANNPAALPVHGDEYPFTVLATAFLLSELTTALTIGFMIYLPFLVVDLVVSAVLAAMGLVMLPPSLVAMPLKLILFVMADGWLLVATRMLATFTIGPSSP